eukprot:g40815.t1
MGLDDEKLLSSKEATMVDFKVIATSDENALLTLPDSAARIENRDEWHDDVGSFRTYVFCPNHCAGCACPTGWRRKVRLAKL